MHRYRAAAVLLLLCLFAQALTHARSASITFDEGPHLAVGYATLCSGDLRLQPVHIHPPLANVMAAAPLLLQNDLPDPRTISGWEIASLSAVTDGVVWQYSHPRRMALASRFPIIGMTLLLGAIVFRWATDLFGPRAGALALFLLAFDPNLIAHGSLVTTDVAVVLWGTATFFLAARDLRRARWGCWATSGVTLGLALASKVSAISLIPPLGLLCLLGPRIRPWRSRLLTAVTCFSLAGLILWAAYGFELRPLPGIPFPVPAATHLEIYRSLQEHYQLGHPSFLLGMNSSHGWWTYFPVAFALKTPLATLLLLSVAIYQLVKGRGRRIGWSQWWVLLLYPALYIASSFFSSVNIGYRHLLPLLPFLYIFISQIANESTRLTFDVSRLMPDVSRLTLHALLLSLPLIALLLSPHYLAYFNLPEGHRYLVDSNLDWGQNLWQLRDWMQENGAERVYYAHFSPARPQVYGVAADFLPPDPRAVEFAPLAPAPGVYAIGATVLQGAYTPDVNTYAWFRTHEPLARLGRALFIYRVPPRPAPAWAAVCAALAPALPPETVRARLGQPDLRVALLDCDQSWLIPTGSAVGVYVLPSETAPPPGATLEAAARHADGSPFYAAYRLASGDLAYPPPSSIAVTLDGPLTFLGSRLTASEAHPGETVELWTFWRVEEVPHRPLSLMAHLVGPDGAPTAVGDGLGLSPDQWRPGDVFMQRHRLAVPEDAAAGEYHLLTGAYWLDGVQRWPVHGSGGYTTDQIPVLEALVVE